MTDRPASPYKLTLFDRLGPDAGLHVRAVGQSLAGAAIAVAGAGMVANRLDVPPWAKVVFTVLVAPAIVAGFALFAIVLSESAGNTWKFLMTSGAGTPPEPDYSIEDSLVMQRRVPEALERYEGYVRQDATAIAPRIRAAELYAGPGANPQRAAELFRQVRDLPGAPAGFVIQATNRLVDLLLGPLDDEGRALVELRRLAERYPGTAAAGHARDAIARIKRDRLTGDGR